uniref:Uncharacterized protein n=1 Tax=Arundo donax TaxID=35708 RepID=A0A0A9T3T4_ARUDO
MITLVSCCTRATSCSFVCSTCASCTHCALRLEMHGLQGFPYFLGIFLLHHEQRCHLGDCLKEGLLPSCP